MILYRMVSKVMKLFANPDMMSSPGLQSDILKALSKADPEQAYNIIGSVENISVDPEIKSVKNDTLEILKRVARKK